VVDAAATVGTLVTLAGVFDPFLPLPVTAPTMPMVTQTRSKPAQPMAMLRPLPASQRLTYLTSAMKDHRITPQ
jgi:hypothetical protein